MSAVRVVTKDGTPVPGATVKIFPADSPVMAVTVPQTDADGYVAVPLPQGTREVGVSVGAVGYAYRTARVQLDPSGAFTMIVDGVSGSLRLRARQGEPHTMAVLLSGGFFESVDFLRGWLRSVGEGHSEEGGETVIPRMTPGPYVFCVIPTADLPRVLSLAYTRPRERCASGELVAHAELSLELN